eukprot:7425467-Pyramimonas_sp.AAC.1
MGPRNGGTATGAFGGAPYGATKCSTGWETHVDTATGVVGGAPYGEPRNAVLGAEPHLDTATRALG